VQQHQKIPLSEEAIEGVKKWKNSENTAKNKGNISVDIMKNSEDLRNFLILYVFPNQIFRHKTIYIRRNIKLSICI
jgi:hypothetical protein